MIAFNRTCWNSTVPCHRCGKPCATDGLQLWCADPACTDRVDAPKPNVHFMSATVEWATPQPFFDRLNEEFKFELDVCATAENSKCQFFFTEEMDGLTKNWDGMRVWMNPPYGRTIGAWVQKAHEASKRGATVVCLLPSRTDTKWWHDHCMQAEIRFVKGRLKFGNATASAPFPSAVVVFRSGPIPHPKTISNK